MHSGTAFTVIWENVPLQEGSPPKPLQLFTFSVTLYNTGDIAFAYKTIPIAIELIKDEKHPVKIGLSDAYIIDKTIYCKFPVCVRMCVGLRTRNLSFCKENKKKCNQNIYFDLFILIC